MNSRFLLLIFFLFFLSMVPAVMADIGPYELPSGVYYPRFTDNDTCGDLFILADSLGINCAISPLGSQDQRECYEEEGIELIFDGAHINYLNPPYPYREYWKRIAYSSYWITEAEWTANTDSTECLAHATSGGCGYEDGYFFAPDTFADSVMWGSHTQFSTGRNISAYRDLYIDFILNIDSIGTSDDDTVCSIRVMTDFWSNFDSIIWMDSAYICANDFDTDSLGEPIFTPFTLTYRFGDWDTLETFCDLPVHILIKSCAKRKLMIDKIKYYDTDGKEVCEGLQDSTLYDSLYNSWGNFDGTMAFSLFGEPILDHFLSIKHIDDLMVETLDDIRGICDFNGNELQHGRFLYLVDPPIHLTDHYFLHGVGDAGLTTFYGSETDSSLQNRLNAWVNSNLTAKKKIAEIDSTTQWWIIPQCWTILGDTEFRCPMRSEFRLYYGMGLALGVEGFMVFYYYAPDNGTRSGLVDYSGNRMRNFYELRNNVNPWIKAVDSTYLSINWQRTYTVCPVAPYNQLDRGILVDTIVYYCDTSSTPNPDAGWFQVAEFRDKEENDYLLIVNRACNYDSAKVTPDVFATIYMNTAEFPAYQYQVTNVDTNKTEQMMIKREDGTLRFSTLLEAGEAKLFKLRGIPIKY